jgi:hypothetical protein
MRAMFLHLQGGETAAALDSSARVLKLVPYYDEVIFNYYDRFAPTVAEVLPHLGDNARAGQAYFRHLLKSGSAEDVAVAWKWLRARSFSQGQLACAYLDILLQHKEFNEAVKVWASYVGARRDNILEDEPAGAALRLEDLCYSESEQEPAWTPRQERQILAPRRFPQSGERKNRH